MKDLSKYYFFKNKEWYYFDRETFRIRLTDKAPKEAIESYKEFYAEDTCPNTKKDAESGD